MRLKSGRVEAAGVNRAPSHTGTTTKADVCGRAGIPPQNAWNRQNRHRLASQLGFALRVGWRFRWAAEGGPMPKGTFHSAGSGIAGWSRRRFLTASATSAAAPLVARTLRAEAVDTQQTPARNPRDPANLTLDVNGRTHRLALTRARHCSMHCASI